MKGKSKGRPKGTNSTVIEDTMLNPYKIYVDAHCYHVVDAESKNDTEKGYGYYTTIGIALKKIVKMQLTNNTKYTLPEFVKAFEDRLTEFENKFNI